MRTKTREFIQHLTHEIDDEDEEKAQALIDEALPVIGLVVMHFNMLEKNLDSLICYFISDRTDAPGLLVIAGMMYGAKVDLFQRLSDDRNAAFEAVDVRVPAYTGLIERLKEVGRLRNLVVHADWNNTDAEGYTYRRLKISKGRMHQEYVQLTTDAMLSIIDLIAQANMQLGRYWEEQDEALRAA